MSLRIYNTLSRELEDFSPLQPGRVRMYVCGMTVYDYCHLGHARSMVAFDVVQRWLKASGLEVVYVRNITDIDDKIIRRAVENGESIRALTDRMIQALQEDADALGIERPTHQPRATEYVPQMLSMISTLEQKGLAYRSTNGDVNYAVRKFPGYGKLSGKSLDELHAGERVAVLDGKDDPLDPVLWKSAKPTEPEEVKWPSEFGPGRPGWHIECSAMACQLLGETIDIHGGGTDLVFPHHENERAQSTCAHGGKVFARYWVHNGFLTMNSAKMAKSVGNVLLVHDLVRQHPGEAIRLALLNGHYRQPLDWTDETVPNARKQLDRLYGALQKLESVTAAPGVKAPAKFVEALEDDINTPMALAELFELAHAANTAPASEHPKIKAALVDAASLLGLLQQSPEAWFKWAPAGKGVDEAEIQKLVDARTAARKAKNYAEGDRIKAQLAAMGVVLEDSAQGTRWKLN